VFRDAVRSFQDALLRDERLGEQRWDAPSRRKEETEQHKRRGGWTEPSENEPRGSRATDPPSRAEPTTTTTVAWRGVAWREAQSRPHCRMGGLHRNMHPDNRADIVGWKEPWTSCRNLKHALPYSPLCVGAQIVVRKIQLTSMHRLPASTKAELVVARSIGLSVRRRAPGRCYLPYLPHLVPAAGLCPHQGVAQSSTGAVERVYASQPHPNLKGLRTCVRAPVLLY
jgi:hypothetical protein